MIHFAEPVWLWLLPAVALRPAILRRLLSRRGFSWPAWPAIVAAASATEQLPKRWFAITPDGLRILTICALILALARPQTVGGREDHAGAGLAVVFALDVSSSMKNRDLDVAESLTSDGASQENASVAPRTRLDVAREAIRRFVRERPGDLLGLVAFANYPDAACPPTLDHETFLAFLDIQQFARPSDDGTNLGDAIILSIEALRELPLTIPRVAILVSDGVNNPAVPRPTPPETAARLAQEFGITLHMIALGPQSADPNATQGPALWAKAGGGELFEASRKEDLDRIFLTIAAMATAPLEGSKALRYQDRSPWCLAFAFATFTLERILAASSRRRRRQKR